MTTPRLLIGVTCIGCLAAITGASAQEGTNARMERHLQSSVSAHAPRQTVVGAQRVPNSRGARAAEGYVYRGQPLYAYAPNYSYQSPFYGYTYQAPSYGYAYEPGYADSYAPGYAATAPASPYYASGYDVTYADPNYDYAPGVSIGIGPVGIGVGPTWGW